MVERAVWISRIHRLIGVVMLVGGLGDIFSTLLDSQLSQLQRGRQAASQSVTIVDGFIMGHRLIREMSIANPLWGAPRIHGELLKLGIEIGQTSVAKYMVRRRGPLSQGWKTFLRN